MSSMPVQNTTINATTTVPILNIRGMDTDDIMAFMAQQLDSVNDQFHTISNNASRQAAETQVVCDLSAKLSRFSAIDHRKDNKPDGDTLVDDNITDMKACIADIDAAEKNLPDNSPVKEKLEGIKGYFQSKIAGTAGGQLINTTDMSSVMNQLKATSDAGQAMQPMTMMDVQKLANLLARTTETMSNVMHKIDEALSAPVNNIK
jgi:hypothetical protein